VSVLDAAPLNAPKSAEIIPDGRVPLRDFDPTAGKIALQSRV
jgi:hypothetical protein